MVFTVKIGYNKETVKIAKLTKIYGRNLRKEATKVWSRKKFTVTFDLACKICS